MTMTHAVIHLFQPDSLELRGHLVMFQSTTLQGQAGLSQELHTDLVHSFERIMITQLVEQVRESV